MRADELTESYSCPCGKSAILEELYYCVGCQSNKCSCCTHEEVVATYCQQCLENVSSAEVIPNRGRCAKCFVCPSCQSVAKIVSRDGAFSLRCVYCPWDSLAFAIAPSPANLIMLLREQERGGPAAQLFKQRLQEYNKMTEEALLARSRPNARHRFFFFFFLFFFLYFLLQGRNEHKLFFTERLQKQSSFQAQHPTLQWELLHLLASGQQLERGMGSHCWSRKKKPSMLNSLFALRYAYRRRGKYRVRKRKA
jgi:hypothetical protein